MRRKSTRRVAPRSYRIHWPSPAADHRVARLPSTVFAGTFPSLALAVTAEPATDTLKALALAELETVSHSFEPTLAGSSESPPSSNSPDQQPAMPSRASPAHEAVVVEKPVVLGGFMQSPLTDRAAGVGRPAPNGGCPSPPSVG